MAAPRPPTAFSRNRSKASPALPSAADPAGRFHAEYWPGDTCLRSAPPPSSSPNRAKWIGHSQAKKLTPTAMASLRPSIPVPRGSIRWMSESPSFAGANSRFPDRVPKNTNSPASRTRRSDRSIQQACRRRRTWRDRHRIHRSGQPPSHSLSNEFPSRPPTPLRRPWHKTAEDKWRPPRGSHSIRQSRHAARRVPPCLWHSRHPCPRAFRNAQDRPVFSGKESPGSSARPAPIARQCHLRESPKIHPTNPAARSQSLPQ